MRYDQRSQEATSYRHLYNSARWRGPYGRRAQQLNAEPLCRMCNKAGRIAPATVADHVHPHKGDEILFYEGELQSLCAPHHDARKQIIEARGYEPGCDAKGRPLDPNHLWNRAQKYGIR